MLTLTILIRIPHEKFVKFFMLNSSYMCKTTSRFTRKQQEDEEENFRA